MFCYGNNLGSKPCACAININWNLYIQYRFVLSQISFLYSAMSAKKICCKTNLYVDQGKSSFQVWLLQTIKQTMWFEFKFEIYSVLLYWILTHSAMQQSSLASLVDNLVICISMSPGCFQSFVLVRGWTINISPNADFSPV